MKARLIAWWIVLSLTTAALSISAFGVTPSCWNEHWKIGGFCYALYYRCADSTHRACIDRWFEKGSEAYNENGMYYSVFTDRFGNRWYFCVSANTKEERDEKDGSCL